MKCTRIPYIKPVYKLLFFRPAIAQYNEHMYAFTTWSNKVRVSLQLAIQCTYMFICHDDAFPHYGFGIYRVFVELVSAPSCRARCLP